MSDEELTVDQVVNKLGVTPRTLHYYEEVGLLTDVRRTVGGHRLYDKGTVERIETILRFKEALGYSLSEIKQLLSLQEQVDQYRRQYKDSISDAERKQLLDESERVLTDLVSRIDEKIERLSHMKEIYIARLTRVKDVLRNTDEES